MNIGFVQPLSGLRVCVVSLASPSTRLYRVIEKATPTEFYIYGRGMWKRGAPRL
ncbi:MAG: hypothetical protein LBQ70_00340 [Prevotellaceae bacterium]|nr:hypothetical protein [Prevotellaceae bacterium]